MSFVHDDEGVIVNEAAKVLLVLFYHVHRVALQAFRSLVPANAKYYLAPFSIKKAPNIYGIIFGSGSTLGMDKFLITAWSKAPSNGEANYDINREDFAAANPSFDWFQSAPTKIQAFEADLRQAITSGKCPDERAIIEICYEHGVRRQHAKPVIKALKEEKTISCDFSVPQNETIRPLKLLPRTGGQ